MMQNKLSISKRKLKSGVVKKKIALANGDYDMVQILSECRNVTHSKYNPKIK